MPTASRKIAFVVNNIAREQAVFERITKAVLEDEPSAICRTWLSSHTPEFVDEICEFQPDVVVTFPLTSRSASKKWYRIKFLTGCTLVCYRTEGLISPRSDGARTHAGQDQYGAQLVDYEIFWGEVARDQIGTELVKQGKLSSLDRTRVVGYPRFEQIREFHERDQVIEKSGFPTDVMQFLEKVPRARRALFVSGFHFADYTDEHIQSAGDLDLQEWSQWMEYRTAVSTYRNEWSQAIEESVQRWPDVQFVLKKHPMEVRHCEYHGIPCHYNFLKKYPNVMVTSNHPTSLQLVQTCGVLFHYGSTVSFEAYMCGTPTVMVSGDHIYGKCKYRPRVDGCSHEKIDMCDVANVIGRWQHGEIEPSKNQETDALLSDVFSVSDIKHYFPSREFAKILLGPLERQSLTLLDPFFRQNVYTKLRTKIRDTRRAIKTRLKGLLGITQESRRKSA